jgi:hypothetical protein
VVGESSGERRRRDRGGVPAVTRTPARLEAVKHNARPEKLEGGLGRSRKVWSAASASGAVSSPAAAAMARRGEDGGSGWRGGGGVENSTAFYTHGSG